MADDIYTSSLRTLVDGNQDVFRYGLFKYEDSEFEDPTYLGFTLELDLTSSLFTEVLPFLEKYAPTRADMNSRIAIYKEFIAKIKMIFNSQESIQEDKDKAIYIKQHYVNNISGLENLQKKFIKWREDKITFELHEDIALFSTYVSQLYNNLTYSYENGRVMIPENLLRFNLYLKFSEIRNYTSIAKAVSNDNRDIAIFNALKYNVTCIVYKLHECNFDFFESKPFDDSVTVAGIDAAPPPHSILKHDIYFRSVSRQMYNPLVRNAISMNDALPDLAVLVVGIGDSNTTGQTQNPSNTNTGSNGNYQAQTTTTQSTFKQEAFNKGVKKPSSIDTYTDETKAYTDESSIDLVEKERRIEAIKKENLLFAPESIKSISDTLENPRDVLANPQGTLNSIGNNLKQQGENRIKKQLQEAYDQLLLKREALKRAFINDLGKKKVLPQELTTNDNVYTNFNQLLQQSLAEGAGDSISNQVINALKNNISI